MAMAGAGVVPAATERGLTDMMVGPVTVNVLAEDEAVLVFWTVTFCVPADASWVLVTVAVSGAELTQTVVSGVAPQYTVEAPLKFVPATVSVKRGPPAGKDEGVSEVMVGPLTVNALVEEEAVLEFWTVTF